MLSLCHLVTTMKFLCDCKSQLSLSLFVQPPSHLHKVLHRIPARWHLQFPLHATVHPQCNSKQQPRLASGSSVQYGTHALVLSCHSQPHTLGSGSSGSLVRLCFHVKAATSNARLACWNNACCVGGIESKDFRPWVKSNFLASLTEVDSQFLLYISTVRRSSKAICWELIVRLVGSSVRVTRVFVTPGKAFHAFHAVFLPMPNKDEVISHPF